MSCTFCTVRHRNLSRTGFKTKPLPCLTRLPIDDQNNLHLRTSDGSPSFPFFTFCVVLPFFRRSHSDDSDWSWRENTPAPCTPAHSAPLTQFRWDMGLSNHYLSFSLFWCINSSPNRSLQGKETSQKTEGRDDTHNTTMANFTKVIIIFDCPNFTMP